jgi:peptidoglycan hydrolase-like protein with peptidoglycan-binding domain
MEGGSLLDKKEFINLIKEPAIKAYKKYNILPSLTIAQAILESNWGIRALGYNLFGIKWTKGCGFQSQELWTREYRNGKPEMIQTKFRKYNSYSESIEDHAKFLMQRRYEKVRKTKNYKEACYQIQNCGYATDPNYAKKLIDIIEAYNLQDFDIQQAIQNEKVPKKQQDACSLKRILKISIPMMKGDDVKRLQELLCNNGHIIEKDGVFGKNTDIAVRNFQRQKGLKVDGIVGPETWKVLNTPCKINF